MVIGCVDGVQLALKGEVAGLHAGLSWWRGSCRSWVLWFWLLPAETACNYHAKILWLGGFTARGLVVRRGGQAHLPAAIVFATPHLWSQASGAPSSMVGAPCSQLPDELWALVLSKFAWKGAWAQAKVLLCWRPGAGRALATQPQLLAQLLSSQYQPATYPGLFALDCAAVCGRADVTQVLLSQHQPDLHVVLSAAQAAAGKGHATVLGTLLEHVRVTWGDRARRSAVDECIDDARAKGHVALYEQLLDQCANSDRTCRRALIDAAAFGQVDIVRMLLRRIAGGRDDYNIALKYAADYGETQAAALLLDAGAGASSFHYKAAYLAQIADGSMLQLLMRHGLRLNEPHALALVRKAASLGRHATARMVLAARVRTRSVTKHLEALMQ